MTDKQIIIDEIDVTSCIYACRKLNKDGLHDCRIPNTAPFCCENIRNCYYKQLKRKEQECEELDKELHKNFEEKDKLHLIIDRLLEASGYDTNTASAEDFEDVYENIRYKKQQLDQLKAENENWQKEYWKLEQGNDFWAEKNSRLRGCLTEIKEIAITGLEGFCPKCSRKECEDNNCIETAIRDILQKISEVIDD